MIVEDSPSINELYKKLFNEESGWNSQFSESFEEAIENLDENYYEFIISDGLVKEEEINGIEFLEKAKSRSPDSIRLFVSGTLTPDVNDYDNFSAFINKKNLNGKELMELVNFLADDDMPMPDKFIDSVFLG